jgi:hypothetical protein
MRYGLALWMVFISLPLSATPCVNVDRTLTAVQKQAWAPSIARQLHVPGVGVLQVFHQGDWRIIYIDTHRSDNAFLFYRGEPQQGRYINLWAGVAQADEEASITQWTQTNVQGIPPDLAQCFAWYVTQHRDM